MPDVLSRPISGRLVGWRATMRHLILSLGVLAAAYAVIASTGGLF
ncbi:MAG: hypothetical protein Q8M38_01790 [Phenylobacterium sp.]|nr:hypothetical protein [Phenylobacterium sp.]